jgi:hypothetical protein
MHMTNNSRTAKPQPVSPTSGIRSRIGHVVRWHAEPVLIDEGHEQKTSSEIRETRPTQNSIQPL